MRRELRAGREEGELTGEERRPGSKLETGTERERERERERETGRWKKGDGYQTCHFAFGPFP